MTIHRTRVLAGSLLAASTLATGLTAGAAQADDSTSAAVPSKTAAAVPAPGSWAVGYSAVVRSTTEATVGHLEVYSPGGGLVRRFASSTTGRVEDVSHDARLVLTAQTHGTGTAFRVWDVAAGQPIEWFKLPGSASAFFTNGGLLTSEEGASGTRTTLRTTSGSWIRTLPALPGARGTQVSPGGPAHAGHLVRGGPSTELRRHGGAQHSQAGGDEELPAARALGPGLREDGLRCRGAGFAAGLRGEHEHRSADARDSGVVHERLADLGTPHGHPRGRGG